MAEALAFADRPTLVAGEVKQALLEALAPAWRATLAGLQEQPGLAEPEEILLAVQLVPERIQIIREARSAEEPAALLVSGVFGVLCADDGSALRDAIAAYIAGTLSATDADAAERALRFAHATRGQGGFVLLVKPATAETRLLLAKVGEDLSEALDLGGIGEILSVH